MTHSRFMLAAAVEPLPDLAIIIRLPSSSPPFDLQHRAPATHHYLFALALEAVASHASAVQPPTTRARGFRSARTSTSDTTPLAPPAAIFAPEPAR